MLDSDTNASWKGFKPTCHDLLYSMNSAFENAFDNDTYALKYRYKVHNRLM